MKILWLIVFFGGMAALFGYLVYSPRATLQRFVPWFAAWMAAWLLLGHA